jgi:hypothetical protein
MDVSDCRFNGLHRQEVTIVMSAFLPESKTSASGPLPDRQPFQQRALDGLQEPLDASGKRGLQRFQEKIYARVTGHGLNEDVDVFRHEDIGD